MTEENAREHAKTEGWTLAGKITIVSERVFIGRDSGRGRSWLRFLKKIGKHGYWVTAHKLKRNALDL